MRKYLLALLFVAALASGRETIKNDTFTEASDTALESHTSDSGGGWQGNSTQFDVLGASDDVIQQASGVQTIIGDEAPSETDLECTVTTVLNGTATTDRGGLIVRAEGTTAHVFNSHDYYALRVDGDGASGADWRMYRYDSGVVDQTPGDCSTDCTGAITSADSDDPIKVRLNVQGTGATVTLTVEYDVNIDGAGFTGFTLAQTILDTDANRITAAGDVGLYQRNTNVRQDDFFCEDLTSDGVVPIISTLNRRRRQ